MLSPEAKDIMDRLMDPNPETRLGTKGSQEVKDHPFFKDIDWKELRKKEPPLIPRQTRFDTGKKIDIKLEEIFKDNSKGPKAENKLNTNTFAMFRVDLLHSDNIREYTDYTKGLEQLQSDKRAIFEKLFEIEKQGLFIVF